MAKIYVVSATEYDDSQIMGIWFDKGKAEKHLDTLIKEQKAAKKSGRKDYWYGHYSFGVEEHDTEDEPEDTP